MKLSWRATFATLRRVGIALARSVWWHERNLRGAINWALFGSRRITDLTAFERRWYSQNGEDGILQVIFDKIDVKTRFCVEFGVENGRECNSRYLIQKQGWVGLLMDGSASGECHIPVHREFVTAENINELLAKYKVPKEFDLLSIDIDGNDYWVWRAIQAYSPRVVVIEYNAAVPPNESKTIVYDPEFQWDGTAYFGAGLLALDQLGRAKGYTLIGCDSMGVNAFFLRDDELDGQFEIREVDALYMPPQYGERVNGKFLGHRCRDRLSLMIDV